MDSLEGAIVVVVAAGIGAFLRGYISTKGTNLATKEDIQKITEIVESVKTQNAVLIEAAKFKNQLRIAALDKRLEVHQQAFVWWRRMFDALHTDAAGKTVVESQQWYVENCLYLEQSARAAFLDAAAALSLHAMLLQNRDDVDSAKANFNRLISGGEAILQAVALPGLTEQERRELIDTEAAHGRSEHS